MRKRNARNSGKTILVIDDNEDYLAASRRIIEREGHRLLLASGGREALEILRCNPVDLVLVDYFMPGMTGEEFVVELRKFDTLTQVILQTGYATEQPPREMMRRLEIQGYHDKSEGPDKLCVWIDVGLRSAYTVQLVHKMRIGIRHALDALPALKRLEPLRQQFNAILAQMTGLMHASDGFVAIGECSEYSILAGTGRFIENAPLEISGRPESNADFALAGIRIMVHVAGEHPNRQDRELLERFAESAARAILALPPAETATISRQSAGVLRGRYSRST